MSHIWSAEVARAVAQHGSMPGLEGRQSQYVRYEGCHDGILTLKGWLQADSLAAKQKLSTDAPAAIGGPSFRMPERVQMTISAAPAEFCLPLKSDRQFKPHFHVEVRVVNSRNMRLPLRVKAFAAFREDLEDGAGEWLPPELRPQRHPSAVCTAGTAALELKGPRVSSFVFQSPYYNHSRDSGSADDAPAHDSASGGSDASATCALGNDRSASMPMPCFPSRVPRERSPQPPLQDAESMLPRADDPDLASPLDLGSVNHTYVARYEFKGLEFAHPTRMSPVQMVFACLIGGRDLLYTVYDVPSISICRADQRMKAIVRLGLPRSVYADVDALRERSSAPTPAGCATTVLKAPQLTRCVESTDGAQKETCDDGPELGAVWNRIVAQGVDGSTGADHGAAADVVSPKHTVHPDKSCSLTPSLTPSKRGLAFDAARADAPGTRVATNVARPIMPVPPPDLALDDVDLDMDVPDVHSLFELNLKSSSEDSGDRPSATLRTSRALHSNCEGSGARKGPLAQQAAASVAGEQQLSTQHSGSMAQESASKRQNSTRSLSTWQVLEAMRTDECAAMTLQPGFSCDILQPSAFDDPEGDLCDVPALLSSPPPAGSSLHLSDSPTCSRSQHAAPPLSTLGAAVSGSVCTASMPVAVPPQRLGSENKGYATLNIASMPTGAGSVYTSRAPCTPVTPTSARPIEARMRDIDDTSTEPPLRRHRGGLTPLSTTEHFSPLKGICSLQTGGWAGLLRQWGSTSRATSTPSGLAHLGKHDNSGPFSACITSGDGWGGSDAQMLEPTKPITSNSCAGVHGSDMRRRLGCTLGELPPIAPLRMPPGEGVTQEDVFAWILSVYDASGLQRVLRREDHKALLSLAGFPPLAGFDAESRISRSQYSVFQQQVLATLRLLRTISHLWNRSDPCIISGFDMDRHAAVAALASQPAGAFICRFSMRKTGCLILSCKVLPQTVGVQEGDVVHLTVAPDDLHRARIDHLILSLPLATHVLDAYTNHRVDKRALVGGGCMSRKCALGLLSGGSGLAAGLAPGWGPLDDIVPGVNFAASELSHSCEHNAMAFAMP